MTYSANVDLFFLSAGVQHRLAQVGPDFVTFRNDYELDAVTGSVEVWVECVLASAMAVTIARTDGKRFATKTKIQESFRFRVY